MNYGQGASHVQTLVNRYAKLHEKLRKRAKAQCAPSMFVSSRKGHTIENAFTDNFAPGAERALLERPWNEVEGARLFVGQIYKNAPGWRTFLQAGSTDIPARLSSSGAGAVIFMPVDDRVAAVCFGHVHIALNGDAFERRIRAEGNVEYGAAYEAADARSRYSRCGDFPEAGAGQ